LFLAHHWHLRAPKLRFLAVSAAMLPLLTAISTNPRLLENQLDLEHYFFPIIMIVMATIAISAATITHWLSVLVDFQTPSDQLITLSARYIRPFQLNPRTSSRFDVSNR